ncbi:MAG: hypothetical protein ACI35P_04990 [Bacillus sp. (in: firmicutes)]
MRHIITINDVIVEENQMALIADVDDLTGVIPKGQMLVDSDAFSFLYIVEKNNEYTYVQLHETLWPQLAIGVANNQMVYLDNEGSSIQLINFVEEFTYLIHNIEGNANYGDEMVSKVEQVFCK